jgi:hypothetical protein
MCEWGGEGLGFEGRSRLVAVERTLERRNCGEGCGALCNHGRIDGGYFRRRQFGNRWSSSRLRRLTVRLAWEVSVDNISVRNAKWWCMSAL